MRVSVPGVPGVYYDTDTGTTAMATVFSVAGRNVPKPKGYAIQALPYLWSFEVDLREVPTDHPIQYLHPEGAQSLGELSPERGVRQAGTELESVLRFAWEVNREVESATNRLIGRSPEDDGVVIEIEEGAVSVGGDELESDEFDIDDDAGEDVGSTGTESFEPADPTENEDSAAFGGTAEPGSDTVDDTTSDGEFGTSDDSDDSDDSGDEDEFNADEDR